MKEKAKEDIKEIKKQRDEYLSGWQRAKADFENYKKSEVERSEQTKQCAAQDWAFNILPILDNISLLEKNIAPELKNNIYIKGVMQITGQLEKMLKNNGIEPIKAKGEKFDPNYHEAIEQVEIKNKESGTIIEEIQKGYKLNSKVIRPARVIVIK